MRGGLSAIQQTLTPEASTILTQSIAEASRRNHGQTTPLHVAATLLSSPSGLLRQACTRSHPNSSHPLQCRALELCFTVALDRLPTATTTAVAAPPCEPPLSNALIAALKRAQAHQRRGCPEQQQQPLLAVKVELEQLIISILDDPSVSRVMKEASFSSPAVKSAIEQAISSTSSLSTSSSSPGPRIGLGFRPGNPNLYLNPRLQQQQGGSSNVIQSEDVRKVMDILGRPSKRNPVLVGEAGAREVVEEVIRRVEKIRDGVLKDVGVVSLEREIGVGGVDKMVGRVKELGGLIERKMLVGGSCSNGVIVDLGDLKWLVDQPASLGISELARGAVVEMAKILRNFGEGRRVWFIGTATCETYLRCQVYHPTMESDWDLQVVSIVAKPPISGMLPRLGTNGGILSSSVESLTPMRTFPMASPPLTRRVSENFDPLRRFSCCPQCTEKLNQELAKVTEGQAEKSSSEVKADATQQSLPFWLQNAKLNNNDLSQNKDQDLIFRRQKEELRKKWSDTCLQLHPSFHRGVGSERMIPSPLSMTGLYNPNLLGRQPSQPKLQQPRSLGGASLQLNISPPLTTRQPNLETPKSPPRSPVRTDLMLGLTKSLEKAQDKAAEKHGVKDFLGCISSESQNNKLHEQSGGDRPVTHLGGDVDSFKKLLKGLMEKVWWQKEAASSIASTIAQCKSGNGKLRAGGGSKGDIWLLFSGPDRVGKKKMAAALSELVCGIGPILISLGSRRDGDESDLNFRGKTAMDRISEAVKRNPFSVIVLQDIDEADMLVRGNIKRAMERGRLVDSHGREISLGNVIFVLTSSWVPAQQKGLSLGGGTLNEEKLISLASGGWQLRISIGEKHISGKRPPTWPLDNDDQGRAIKQRKEVGPGLAFDLNQMADIEDDRLDGSHNSSDLTVEHEEEHLHQNRVLSPASSSSSAATQELLGSIDEAIIFKPVDFIPIRQNIERSITSKFSTILGDKFSLKIEREALEKIVSGVWLGQTALESWLENALVPSCHQLKSTLNPEERTVTRLELDSNSGIREHGDWLPRKISVVTDGR